eukprot:scaffold101737_cov29-Tisochrysis_lutea.AAC.4
MCNAMTRSGPRALCSSAAHTEESTPPETRTRTRLSPTDSRMYSIADCSRQAIVYEPERPHTLKRKLEKIALPSTDRSTSGWNCTPYSRFSSHSIAATMSPERPVTRNPSAGVSIESPCVRSTSVFSPIPSKSLDSPSSLTSNTPSSRLAFLATVPPCLALARPQRRGQGRSVGPEAHRRTAGLQRQSEPCTERGGRRGWRGGGGRIRHAARGDDDRSPCRTAPQRPGWPPPRTT